LEQVTPAVTSRRDQPSTLRNKATSANLFTDWEAHGSRTGTNNTGKTPGQAFTTERGVGQIPPLKKDFSQLAQIGLIGYDQWRVTRNGASIPIGPITWPAGRLPYYSVHAISVQATYIPHEELQASTSKVNTSTPPTLTCRKHVCVRRACMLRTFWLFLAFLTASCGVVSAQEAELLPECRLRTT
jgi:hypothetical protein